MPDNIIETVLRRKKESIFKFIRNRGMIDEMSITTEHKWICWLHFI